MRGTWSAGGEDGGWVWAGVGARTGWDGRGAALDELVIGRAGGLGEVCNDGDTLGVNGRQAECRAPDVELENHGGLQQLRHSVNCKCRA